MLGIIPVVDAATIAPGDGTALPGAAETVGRIGWLDLTVSDASATRDVYRKVVGRSVHEVEMEDRSGATPTTTWSAKMEAEK